ncbi:hypothetical protein [Aestuariibacter salexigens]|uniref:hypothetical protein n=1 Tax=Aestuariibacter salexigens TaxID=226010 RepID=UPI00041DC803|nr:hypothetical protein [Aestuariibacter salexigens]
MDISLFPDCSSIPEFIPLKTLPTSIREVLLHDNLEFRQPVFYSSVDVGNDYLLQCSSNDEDWFAVGTLEELDECLQALGVTTDLYDYVEGTGLTRFVDNDSEPKLRISKHNDYLEVYRYRAERLIRNDKLVDKERFFDIHWPSDSRILFRLALGQAVDLSSETLLVESLTMFIAINRLLQEPLLDLKDDTMFEVANFKLTGTREFANPVMVGLLTFLRKYNRFPTLDKRDMVLLREVILNIFPLVGGTKNSVVIGENAEPFSLANLKRDYRDTHAPRLLSFLINYDA